MSETCAHKQGDGEVASLPLPPSSLPSLLYQAYGCSWVPSLSSIFNVWFSSKEHMKSVHCMSVRNCIAGLLLFFCFAVLSFLTVPMSKMSEWVKKKTVRQDHFFVRPIPLDSHWHSSRSSTGDQQRQQNASSNSYRVTNGSFPLHCTQVRQQPVALFLFVAHR